MCKLIDDCIIRDYCVCLGPWEIYLPAQAATGVWGGPHSYHKKTNRGRGTQSNPLWGRCRSVSGVALTKPQIDAGQTPPWPERGTAVLPLARPPRKKTAQARVQGLALESTSAGAAAREILGLGQATNYRELQLFSSHVTAPPQARPRPADTDTEAVHIAHMHCIGLTY